MTSDQIRASWMRLYWSLQEERARRGASPLHVPELAWFVSDARQFEPSKVRKLPARQKPASANQTSIEAAVHLPTAPAGRTPLTHYVRGNKYEVRRLLDNRRTFLRRKSISRGPAQIQVGDTVCVLESWIDGDQFAPGNEQAKTVIYGADHAACRFEFDGLQVRRSDYPDWETRQWDLSQAAWHGGHSMPQWAVRLMFVVEDVEQVQDGSETWFRLGLVRKVGVQRAKVA